MVFFSPFEDLNMFGVPVGQQHEAEHISVCSHFSLAARDSGTAAGGSKRSVQSSRKKELLHFGLHTLISGDPLQTSRSCLLLSR